MRTFDDYDRKTARVHATHTTISRLEKIRAHYGSALHAVAQDETDSPARFTVRIIAEDLRLDDGAVSVRDDGEVEELERVEIT